jgi:F-type H+-transporting ATPase subunit b
MSTLLAPALNLGILLFIIFYYTRKPFMEFVRNRSTSLRDDLQRVADQLKQAQQKYEEFSAKLKAMDAEVRSLRDQAKQDGEAMRLRLLADARKLSTVIADDARTAADALYEDFRAQLRSDFATRVLERAEKLLRERLTGDDRARIRQDFSRQVERMQ